MARRTDNERQADEFDLKLYRLISAARELAADAWDEKHRSKWRLVANYLDLARPHVRDMMDGADRAETAEERAGNG